MSAINTAAIAPPHTGPRPPGLPISRPNLNHDYDDYRHGPFTHTGPPAPNSSNVATYNPMYNSSRMLGGIAYDPSYAQAMPQQSFDSREMSPFPIDLRPPSQQAIGIAPPFGQSVGYATPSLHHTSSFGSHHENDQTSHQPRHAPSTDWTQTFQGMSLGR